MTPYEELANAVIVQAASDWREAARTLERTKYRVPAARAQALARKEETERFFLSDYFKTLTALDGKMILARLRKEAGL